MRESKKKLIFGLLPRAGRKEEKEKGKLISLLSLLRFERKKYFFYVLKRVPRLCFSFLCLMVQCLFLVCFLVAT